MIKEKKTEIVWRAAESGYSTDNPLWYMAVIGGGIVLLILAFIQKNFFFGIFIVLAATLLVTLARKKPQAINFKINEKGVAIGRDIFYTYENLEGFTIHKRSHRPDEIVLKRKVIFNPFVKFSIDSQNVWKAKEILEQHIKDEDYEESFIDIFADLFRF